MLFPIRNVCSIMVMLAQFSFVHVGCFCVAQPLCANIIWLFDANEISLESDNNGYPANTSYKRHQIQALLVTSTTCHHQLQMPPVTSTTSYKHYQLQALPVTTSYKRYMLHALLITSTTSYKCYQLPLNVTCYQLQAPADNTSCKRRQLQALLVALTTSQHQLQASSDTSVTTLQCCPSGAVL